MAPVPIAALQWQLFQSPYSCLRVPSLASFQSRAFVYFAIYSIQRSIVNLISRLCFVNTDLHAINQATIDKAIIDPATTELATTD